MIENSDNFDFYNEKNVKLAKEMKRWFIVIFSIAIIVILVGSIPKGWPQDLVGIFIGLSIFFIMLLGCIFVFQEITALKYHINIACDETKAKQDRVISLVKLKIGKVQAERIFF